MRPYEFKQDRGIQAAVDVLAHGQALERREEIESAVIAIADAAVAGALHEFARLQALHEAQQARSVSP